MQKETTILSPAKKVTKNGGKMKNLIIISGLMLLMITFSGCYMSEHSDNDYYSLQEENDQLQNQIQDYQDKLSEANGNIEEANSNIEDAKGYAWNNYYDMGYALDDLDTVDTVPEP